MCIRDRPYTRSGPSHVRAPTQGKRWRRPREKAVAAERPGGRSGRTRQGGELAKGPPSRRMGKERAR
eukprot:14676889-Alexandrium_andersonii.AAC.1